MGGFLSINSTEEDVRLAVRLGGQTTACVAVGSCSGVASSVFVAHFESENGTLKLCVLAPVLHF